MGDSRAVDAVRSAVDALNVDDVDGYLGCFDSACRRWIAGFSEPLDLTAVGDGLRTLAAAFDADHPTSWVSSLMVRRHEQLPLRLVAHWRTEDLLPTRAVIRDDDGRQVDLHPITYDDAGRGWQAKAMPNGDDCEYPADGFTTGSIADVVVGCLSADLQLAHHLGYAPRPHDRADMARLAQRFGLQLRAPYSPDPA